jgi:hypothetical protein
LKAKRHYTIIPGYPNCAIELIYQKQETIRTCLNDINNVVHANMKKIFTSKLEAYNLNGRDVLLK